MFIHTNFAVFTSSWLNIQSSSFINTCYESPLCNREEENNGMKCLNIGLILLCINIPTGLSWSE